MPVSIMVRKYLIFLWIACCSLHARAQSDEAPAKTPPRYFIGVAVGASFALGDFGDTEVDNPDAGFAQNGRRYDLYGGYLLNERVTLTAGLRLQRFATDLSEVVSFFDEINPGIQFRGENNPWQTYYLLVGAAYKLPIGKKYALYPRFGIGPLWVESPGLEVQASNGVSQNDFARSSETGLGLGYEIGIGLRTDLGKRFALLPTFTFSGGRTRLDEVQTRLNSVSSSRDLEARIQSFNLGLSLAIRL